MFMRTWNSLKMGGAVVAAVLLMAAQARAAIAYNFSSTLPGNQVGPYSLGTVFNVSSPIAIDQLGTFDNGADGIGGVGINVAIYKLALSGTTITGGTLVTPSVLFSGTAQPLLPGTRTRLASISPVTIGAGTYMVVANHYGVGESEVNYNPYFPPGAPNGVNGASANPALGVTFGGGYYHHNGGLAWGPTLPTGWFYDDFYTGSPAAPRYAAGNFDFTPVPGAVTVDNFVARWYTNAQGILPYRLFIPTNYSAATRYPITLFLHGAGERGTDNRLQLTGQTGCLVFASETNQLKYPSFMVAPQCPTTGSWTDATRRAQVLGLMNSLTSQYSIDTNRLYITGLSMGGMGTWDYIGQYPNMYAAAIPMSGSGTVSLATRMIQTPIWNFHAANDGTVNVSGSRTMIDAVRRAGGNPIYTEYAIGGHVIWTPAYNTPILMDWVYAQRRGTNPAARPLLSINVPTDRPIFASSASALDLSGTASDGSTGPTSVTWTNYGKNVSRGGPVGTTNWTAANVILQSVVTNLILVTGQGTSWYPSFGGNTSFNDTLAVIFPPFISLQPESRAVNEGGAVTFTVAVNPAAPSPRYQWRWNGTNIAGATAVSLALDNVQGSNAGAYSVRITNQFGAITSSNALLTVNRLPVADASATQPLVIAPLHCDATVALDGSRSSDPDGDPLHFSWFKAGAAAPLATGMVAVVSLPPGVYPLTLVVDDGLGTNSQSFTVGVLSLAEAVEHLIALVNLQAPKPHPLATSLSAALASINRNAPTPAINQLEAFQNKTRAQVAPSNPALAQTFIRTAQQLVAILSARCSPTRPPAPIATLRHQSNGKLRMGFSGPQGFVYILEASTNLVSWEKIGVAADCGFGEFEVEDVNASQMPARFYRVVVP